MRIGFAVVLALALGALLGHYLLADNGYVLVSFRGVALETSVPVALFFVALAYVALRGVVWLWRTPRRVRHATARLRQRWSARAATRGYIALAAGDLGRGERLLTLNARQSGAPLLNYLAAARLAHQQRDRARRDGWLDLALEQEPAAADAVLLNRAEMLLEDGDWDAALAALQPVRDRNPKHAQALRLQGEVLWRARRWEALAALLPAAQASTRVPAEQVRRWSADAYSALLARAGLDEAAIERCWEQAPKALRQEPGLVRARLRALVRAGAAQAADAEIRRQLREQWDADLVALYGELRLPDTGQQLKNAETFLRERPQDPDLLLAVGRLSFRNQLWGKARSYLETCLAVRPSAEAWAELGRLMQKIGDPTAAGRAFQRGLEMKAAEAGKSGDS